MVTLAFGLFYIGLFAMAVAAVVSGVFYGLARLLTRNVTDGRRTFLRSAVLLPFVSAAWIGAVTLAQLSMSLSDDGRDALRLDLPNGYVFTVEKGADKGNIAGPGGKPLVVDLRRLQVAGAHVFGTRFLADEMARLRDWYPEGLSGAHMILDTGTGREVWLEERAFEAEARALGVTPALRPIAEMRAETASGLPNGLALAMALGGPLVALVLLVRRGIRLRRGSPSLAASTGGTPESPPRRSLQDR